MVVLIILLGVGAMIAFAVMVGSRETIPGANGRGDPGGHYPNARSDMLPSKFDPGVAPLPDIEIAEHATRAGETDQSTPARGP